MQARFPCKHTVTSDERKQKRKKMAEKIHYFWENKAEGGVVSLSFGAGSRTRSNKEFDLSSLTWGKWNLGLSGSVLSTLCHSYPLRLNNLIFGRCGSKEVSSKVEKIMCVRLNF